MTTNKRNVLTRIKILGVGHLNYMSWDNVSFQTNLEKNPSNSSYIFLLDVNFENLTFKLHVFIIFFMFVKFQEYQRYMLSIKCLY